MTGEKKGRLDIAFFGSGPFAVPSLERLIRISEADPSIRLLRVVTRPDRPAGRGRKRAGTPVHSGAAARGIDAETPPSANDPGFLDRLEALAPDLFLVADYGEMLRRRFRSLPRLGAWNLHASMLPRHRGAAPVAYALIHGDRTTGVTLFRIEKELDSGPILDAVELEILPMETAGELEERLAAAAADLLERALERFAAGDLRPEPQDGSRATLAPKLRKEDGAIDWERGAGEIACLACGLNPWPGAYTFLRSGTRAPQRVVILRARPLTGWMPPPAPPAPGEVLRADESSLWAACGSGALEVLEIQRAGKAPLAAVEFLRGARLRPGDRFVNRP